ncbi:hypothetical protein H5410_012704 [Solanum commersonii]|uniref:PHD-type domain-containing protein n=1 Tax=Solanum commersonii TaxID=4109 RepID=A0A9J6ASF1_SOLCO|nr:hypothetical protein H5410_012704 [Solanum commersonii]
MVRDVTDNGFLYAPVNCKGCQTTGDPNKFMYCKRCDAAYHCHCMQPPHKNVSSGPYLCPKHTKCHSCCSSVPGNGLSVRWFLGYTCCDACGRLFMKRKYCQVCLKVYRDSETTPMVCCDICEHWVHSQCDGISDEKYLQFQVDGNLPYSCPKCRGYSYQSINPENAVQELWRRRDLADRDLIASLRAGAGLPVEDEMFSISPFSDDEDTALVVKNEHKKSLKFSRKGLVDKSPQKSKEYGKKSRKEKGLSGQNEGHPDAPSGGYSAGDVKNDELQVYGELDNFSSPSGSLTEGICSFNMAGVIKHKFIDEVAGNTGKRTVQRKGRKPQRLDGDDVGIQTSMPKTSKEPKGVIHLGSLDKNIAGSPKSDASSCQKEQELTTSHGNEDLVQLREKENSERNETAATLGGEKGNEDLVQLREKENSERNETAATLGGEKESNLTKIKKVSSEATHFPAKVGGKFADGSGPYPPLKTSGILGKRSNDSSVITKAGSEVPATRDNKLASVKHVKAWLASCDDLNEEKNGSPSLSNLPRIDPRPLQRPKFKNPYHESQNALASPGEEEKSMDKGHESKRTRSPAFEEKASTRSDDNSSQRYEDIDDFLADKWILQKLGQNAKGKRVEFHHLFDNTWHRGTVIEVFEDSSVVSVAVDDGNMKNLELGKQGIPATGFASEVAAAASLCFHVHKRAACAGLRGKKKSRGHFLIASLTPFHSVILKTCGRLSSNFFYGSSSKTLCAYHQNSKLHSTSLMGAEHYPPPWFSVAPMMEWTDNHYRTLARLISKKAWLYSEMLAAETIVYQTGNLDRFLAYGPEQHPIVLQIGGNNLENLAKATQLATPYGYDEINFNCGCPSPRVAGHGCFGVRLMLDPKELGFYPVRIQMIAAAGDFIYKVSSQSPTRHFIIHSRKALLNGISPADNRRIPPLKYEYYYALLRDFPDLQFTINGGINSIDEVNAARMEGAHGVMLGRAAYSNPWQILGLVDSAVYGAPLRSITRRQVLEQYQVYGDSVVRMYGLKPHIRDVVKPLLGLFHAEPRNVVWKRKVDAALLRCTTIKSILEETLGEIPDRVLDAPLTEMPSGSSDTFIKAKSLLPPPYTVSEEELLKA